MTMQNGSAFGSAFGWKAPDFSQASLQRGSTSFGLKVVSIISLLSLTRTLAGAKGYSREAPVNARVRAAGTVGSR